MGCNCKNAKKVEALLPNANDKTYKKHSFMGVLLWIWGFIKSILQKCIIVVLICVLSPIIICILLFNILFRGGMFLEIPKFLQKKMKQYETEVNETNLVGENGTKLSN